MDRRGFTLALVTAAAALVVSAVSACAAPRLRLEQTVWDFGVLTNRPEVTHDFMLRNDGDSSLEITRVVSSCNLCLSASVEKRSIPPGQEGRLHCRLGLRGLPGQVARTITLSSNDPENPSVVVGLTGVSVPLFDVTPQELQLDLSSGQRTALAQILPLVQLHAPLSQVQLDTTNMIAQISTEGGTRFILAVQARPTLPRGRTRFRASISSTNSADPLCLVDGVASNPLDLEVLPPSLRLLPKAEPQNRILWLRQHGAQPMTLLDVIPPSDTIRVTVEPDATGLNYRMDVLAWKKAASADSPRQLVLKMRDRANHDHSIPVPITVEDADDTNP
jgi:hypothetical protein